MKMIYFLTKNACLVPSLRCGKSHHVGKAMSDIVKHSCNSHNLSVSLIYIIPPIDFVLCYYLCIVKH